MKNELMLENYGVYEMQNFEKVETDAGVMLVPYKYIAAGTKAAWHEVTEFFGGFAEAGARCKCW
jgi:hypothetical protein